MTDEITSFHGENFFLSNFFPCTFSVPGLGVVRTAEHAYQASKAVDEDDSERILRAESPGTAKQLAQTVPVRDDWDVGGRISAMQAVLQAKFGRRELAGMLRDTGTAVLIEGNEHHDNFWGDCRCGRAECAGPGRNMLGELLMAERAALPDDNAVLYPPPKEDLGWDGMREWLLTSLTGQPAGLEIGLGPQAEVYAGVPEFDDDPDDEAAGTLIGSGWEVEPETAVNVQFYVLEEGVILVRRSQLVMQKIRFVHYRPEHVPLNTWLYDDPFKDCTDGYLYTRDPAIAVDACISWFRTTVGAPGRGEIGCHFGFAEDLPDGLGEGTRNRW